MVIAYDDVSPKPRRSPAIARSLLAFLFPPLLFLLLTTRPSAATSCTRSGTGATLFYSENSINGRACFTQCGTQAATTCPSVATYPVGCGSNAHTAAGGVASRTGCLCDTGYYGFPACTICPLNSYCTLNATAPTPCPSSLVPGADPALQFTTAGYGSTSFDQCTCPYFATQQGNQCVRCPASRYILNSTCIPCPPNFYCQGNGFANPCSRWSVCKGGSAGVGLTCANGSFFEPHAAGAFSTMWPIRGLANATAALYVNSTSGAQTVLGSGSSPGCATGLKPSFRSIVDAVYVAQSKPPALFVADRGCDAVRVVTPSFTYTVLGGIGGSYAMLLMPDGLIMVAGATQLWGINPLTNVSRPLVSPFYPGATALGFIPASALSLSNYVVLAVTGSTNNISFLSSDNWGLMGAGASTSQGADGSAYSLSSNSSVPLAANWTLMDSMLTPTTPIGVAYAGAIVYSDGVQLWQLSAGGASGGWFDLLDASLLAPRYFATPGLPYSASEAGLYLDWNVQVPGSLVLGQTDRYIRIDVCNPCPANSTTTSSPDVPGLVRCQCAATLYMMANQVGCSPCVQGAYCPFGTVTPIACPTGFWCGPGQSAPTPCDPSVYCGPQSYDQYGHVVGGSTGAPQCSVGYYRGASSCLKCPNGSTTTGVGTTSVTDCVCGTVNAAGLTLYTFLNTSSGQCTVCPAGSYCPVGSYQPIPCPAGSYCGTGALGPTTCTVGFYCPLGASEPISCEAGTYCPVGSGTRTACYMGYYCPTEATSQVDCPAASYCPTGSGAPTPCPAGAYCPALASNPTSCPPGSYCPASSSVATQCPAASTSDPGAPSVAACYCVANYYYYTYVSGGGLCVSCPIGATSYPRSTNFSDCSCSTGYKLAANFSVCVACRSDEYCPGGAARPCPAGYVCSAAAASVCPIGYYCPGPTNGGSGQSPAPAACPPGFFCPYGSSAPINCTAGNYCPGTLVGNVSSGGGGNGTGGGTPPPISSYLPILCPGGFKCPATSSAPIPCRAGYQCASGSVQDSIPCTAGLYCPAMSSAGIPCPAGAVCAQGASAPAVCPGGQFCAPGAAQGAVCPVGAFCAPGAGNYTTCPPGYVCPNSGLSAPVPCPSGGYYCPRGSVAAIACGANMDVAAGARAYNASQCLCMPGFYLLGADATSSSCVACPDLTFQPSLTRVTACQPCPWGSLDGGRTCPPQPTTSGAPSTAPPPPPETTPAPSDAGGGGASIGVIAGGAGAAVAVVAAGFGIYYATTVLRGVGSMVGGAGGTASLKNAEAGVSREDEEAGRRLLGRVVIGRGVASSSKSALQLSDVVVLTPSHPLLGGNDGSQSRKHR